MPKQKALSRQTPRLSDAIRQVLLSWLLAATIEYFLLPAGLRDLSGLDGLAQMSLIRAVGIACGSMILLYVLSRFANTVKAQRWALVVLFGILVIAAVGSSFTWGFLAVCLLILILLMGFAVLGWNEQPEPAMTPKKSPKAYLWITAGLSIVFFLFVSAWTLGRVYSFHAPTFDFGIFSQMFYYMRKTGLPLTTVERDGLLSHFAVHVSPIYYLLLPFYALVPTPATLQVLQAAVLASAVIPLWLIGKHHGLSGAQRMLLCAVLLLYPAFSGGASYDIHENCFLTPLLLWLFYGIDRRNTVVTAIAAILTLAVKEDAAVYVAVIALWLILKSALRFKKEKAKDLITGAAMLAVSLAWFFLATAYLSKSGDGVMTYRYENLIADGSSSLVAVIKSVLLNPMKALYECVDPDKLKFIAITLLPLLGLPLLTRRYERYILLIPYILVNLISDYPQQHSIYFQYCFGPIACMMYLTVVNLAELKIDWHRTAALAVAAAVCAGCWGRSVLRKAIPYPKDAIASFDEYQNIRDALDTIPEDARVTANTLYAAYLSQRETLYVLRYASTEHLLESEYVVLKPGYAVDFTRFAANGADDGYENLIKLLEEQGYTQCQSIENTLVIYHRPSRIPEP